MVSAPRAARADGRLTIDRLSERAEPVEVVVLDGLEVADRPGAAREPHRHDYHELIWTRSGTGHHLLDDRTVSVVPQTVTVIGRGQVHVFERAHGVSGAVVRFGEELLHGGAPARADPTWLLAGCGGRVVAVPDADAGALEATIATLAAESSRPPDERSSELQRHLLTVLLLWVERWYDAARGAAQPADDAAVELYRRFARVLERDFASRHDASHYADALALPPAALSRALVEATGRSTKELVTDRVMIEAARLLRFTDLTISEVAFRTGFGDPLYFSRAFKRHAGVAPTAYRDRARGARQDG